MLQTPSNNAGAGGQPSNLSEAMMADLLSNWRLTPATMMAHLDPSWIPAKWLQYLSLKIAQAIARGSCGLLISAPPRHGKSMLSTIATPLYCLENFPTKNVVIATYGEELSTDFSRQVRDLIQQNQDQLRVRLRSDTQRVTNFLTTQGGGLKAVGLRGAITGRGANVLVIDDYIKEPKEAMSPSYLDDLWTWFLTVARTRLEPGAVVIILATRWVANDLHGRIKKMQLQTGRTFYEYIELPALAIEGEVDPIGREPGETLFMERYKKEEILAIKEELGSRWFNAMFQQRPDDEENAVVQTKWFQRITRARFQSVLASTSIKYPVYGDRFTWVRFWDFASTKDAGDFTVGTLALYDKATRNFYIVHICRGQFSSARAELEFSKCIDEDFNLPLRPKVGMEQEPGSSGEYAVRHFEKKAREVVQGARVEGHRATTSKLLSAQPFLAAAEGGHVFLVSDDSEEEGFGPSSIIRVPEDPDGAKGLAHYTIPDDKWIKAFYEEIEFFPEASHDDQMDSASGAYKMASGKKALGLTFGRGEKDPTRPGSRRVPTGQSLVNSTTARRSSTGGVTFGRRKPS